MNKNTAILIVFAVLMANISVAMADVRARIDWTGELKITGFSSVGLPPGNPDSDPSTLTYEWTIDDGSSQTIDATACNQPLATGSILLVGARGPGQDGSLDINAILGVAMLLPEGNTTFPPGVIPLFQASGSPISTIVLKEDMSMK